MGGSWSGSGGGGRGEGEAVVRALRMRRAWRRLRPTRESYPSARILNYNILADGLRLALSPKHAYCPLPLREWAGEAGRCERLARELAAYDADILCLQECSFTAFNQLQEAINRTAGCIAYQGIHSSQCIHEHTSFTERKRCAGLPLSVPGRPACSPASNVSSG